MDAEGDGILDSVILPNDSIGKKLKGLRKATLSAPNRLRSIAEDARFVQEVSEAHGLPLVANERCGSWYVPPERRAGIVYFKSTDGHMNQWAISSRRLNLHLLEVIARHDGCVIVDSTRRGKSMPDALSKTVPIWCAVMNRLLFPEDNECHEFRTPPKCISRSEHQQIEQRLDGFVHQIQALELAVTNFKTMLSKPLRPIWTTRESTQPSEPPTYEDFHPVVLCMASRLVTEGDVAADGYIQGAGDDNEGWSQNLTADMFWRNRTALLKADESRIKVLTQELVERQHEHGALNTAKSVTLIKPTDWLYIGHETASAPSIIENGLILSCGLNPDSSLQNRMKSRYVHLTCRPGKLGSRDLRQQLHKIHGPVLRVMGQFVLVCCDSDHGLGIGVALAALCLRDASTATSKVNKDFIKQRLSWISLALPEARPLRTTLQSVNEFLMSRTGDNALQ